MTRDIYAPSTGESIQIGQHTNTYSISISDELLNTVKMSRVSLVNARHYLLPWLIILVRG